MLEFHVTQTGNKFFSTKTKQHVYSAPYIENTNANHIAHIARVMFEMWFAEYQPTFTLIYDKENTA